MATTSKQRLALAICDFLTTCATDGTLAADDKESIDVAVNCIAESFQVDPSDKAAVAEAVGSQNLLQIYGVYEKLKSSSSSSSSSKPSASAAAATSSPSPSSPSPSAPATEADKKRAEDLKSQGNRAMAARDYAGAVGLYTQALALWPGNAIYLSNRAAAHSAARDHESARADAEAAVAADPAYTKAWSRLGLARFALGDARGSMAAYKAGIDHEGSGGSEAMRKGYETARRRVEELEAEALAGAGAAAAGSAASSAAGSRSADPMSGLASLLGGGGGGAGAGGGAGGMPDLSSIMSNPMFASMAQSLMSNPDMMSNLMSNPRLREMADQFSSGGGMPDLGSLMSDPSIAEMARNMMGGNGDGDGAGAGAGRGAGGNGQ